MPESAPIRSLPNASRKLEAVDGKIEREMGRVQSHDDVFAARSKVWGNLAPEGGELVPVEVLASLSFELLWIALTFALRLYTR